MAHFHDKRDTCVAHFACESCTRRQIARARSDELNARSRGRNKSAFDSAGNQVIESFSSQPSSPHFSVHSPRKITSPHLQSKPYNRDSLYTILNRCTRLLRVTFWIYPEAAAREWWIDWRRLQSISSNFVAIQYFQLRPMGVNVFRIVLSATSFLACKAKLRFANFISIFPSPLSPRLQIHVKSLFSTIDESSSFPISTIIKNFSNIPLRIVMILSVLNFVFNLS